jgi:hypothetical protein
MRQLIGFDEDTHTYTLPDGRPVRANVTKILRATILAPLYRGIDPEVIERAGIRGSYVHEACLLADTHELDVHDMHDTHPEWMPYVCAWNDCLRELQAEVLAHKVVVYHPTDEYAGTIDVIVRDRRTRLPVIVDQKTGDTSGTQYQLAAYLKAAWARRDQHPWLADVDAAAQVARWCVELKANATYKVTRFAELHKHLRVWDACVTVYNHQEASRD